MQNQRPYSPIYAEHYWSGGAAEKAYIFLQGNNLAERFAAATQFTVAEFGFGTALNFLLTWQLWNSKAPPQSHLTYISYEQYPLTQAEIAALHSAHPQLATFLASYNPQPGWNTQQLGTTTLHLYVGEAGQGIATQPHKADAWFLDGFSPAKNPALWVPELFTQAAAHSNPHATFATYSAARAVRESLTQAGFIWQKEQGFPPKRHMLKGVLKLA